MKSLKEPSNLGKEGGMFRAAARRAQLELSEFRENWRRVLLTERGMALAD